MPIEKNEPKAECFNRELMLPYELRIDDFAIAMRDVYDFFYDVNKHLLSKGLERLDDMLRPANLSGLLSGLLSDMLTVSLAKHSRSLVANCYHNGLPDLLLKNTYPNNSAKAGEQGIEIKTTKKAGGAVDTHGARQQWMCVFVYKLDTLTQPAVDRRALTFTEVYLGQVTVDDFRRNLRGDLGTPTSALHADGIAKLRQSWVYRDQPYAETRRAAKRGIASQAKAK